MQINHVHVSFVVSMRFGEYRTNDLVKNVKASLEAQDDCARKTATRLATASTALDVLQTTGTTVAVN